ncbi:MAG: NAD(P)-dependent oxidoreductase [Acidimicrobiales bacterium]
MKILFADQIPKEFRDQLVESGHEVCFSPDLNADTLADNISDNGVLVVRSTKVTAATIEAGEHLSLIVRAGAGTNTIDKQAAADRGVYVTNVPGKNAIAVAELAMGLLLAIDRRIADNVVDLRDDRWNKKVYSTADGLFGKNVAIIGVGAIGLAFAERARAFGITPHALRKDGRSSDTENKIRAAGIRLVDSEDELLSLADVVSLHVPASPQTVGMVDSEFLARMKPNAILLNTSRGEVIDEAALINALDNGLRAGVDVYCDEPSSGSGTFTSKLAQHPNVVGTHHIGASTDQSQNATSTGVVAVIDAYGDGRVFNCVNMQDSAEATASLIVRHYDRVGVLAQVFAVLRRSGINVGAMENSIFAGSNAAVATIDIAGALGEDVLETIGQIDEVIQASAWKRS